MFLTPMFVYVRKHLPELWTRWTAADAVAWTVRIIIFAPQGRVMRSVFSAV
jgi:hypothetical protein